MTPLPLPDELLATLPPAVRAYLRALEAIAGQVVRLTARVAELGARLAQTSPNSSKPPSSDGPHVKPAPPGKPSGKAKGGQPGHPRNDRPLLPPDAVVELRPAAGPDGRHALAGDDPDPVVHQVVERPPVRPHVDAGSAVGAGLLLHADILLAEWKRVRDGGLARSAFPSDTLAWLRPEVATLLAAGAAAGGKTAGVCASVRGIEAGLSTFATTAGVEPTNTAAERAVRHAVCWRKTSGGTDSESGSRFVERVLTVVATCRQQDRDVLGVLTAAVRTARTGPPAVPRPRRGVNAYAR